MHRLWRGIGAQALLQVILVIQELLLVPLFLRAWGSEGYGRWLSIIAIVSYVSLLDLGGQSYIANLLAIERVREDDRAFQRVLSESVSLYIVIVTGALAIILLLLSTLPNSTLLSSHVSLGINEGWVVGLMAAAYLIAIPSGVYVKVYQSSGLFPRGTMIGNSMRILGLGLLVLLLYARVTPPVYAAGFLLTGILTPLVILWDTRRRIAASRGVRIGLAEARRGMSHLGGSIHFWLISLGQAIKRQGVLLILASFASPVAVAVYVTHRLLSNSAGYVATVLHAPLWPELTFLWAEKRYATLERVVSLTIKLVVFLGGASALLFWVGGSTVYPSWTGRHLEFEPLLLAILMIQGVIVAGYSSSSWVLMSTNHHKVLGVSYIANAALTVGLSVLLVKPFGVQGVAFAALSGEIVFGLSIFPVLTSSLLRMPVSKIYGAFFAALIALVPLAGAAGVALAYGEGWWSILLFTLSSAGLAYPILRLLLSKAEMERSIHWILDLRMRLLNRQSAHAGALPRGNKKQR